MKYQHPTAVNNNLLGHKKEGRRRECRERKKANQRKTCTQKKHTHTYVYIYNIYIKLVIPISWQDRRGLIKKLFKTPAALANDDDDDDDGDDDDDERTFWQPQKT